MTKYLLLILFVATMGSRALGLDLGIAPGISLKNILLYVAVSVIAIDIAMTHKRKLDGLSVVVPFSLLILYAGLTWLVTVLFLENPYYGELSTLIRLKTKLVDQLLVFLVFFYGVVNWRDALWLLKSLLWVGVVGCFITVIDTFDMPDLGIVSARDRDGRIEGIIGSSQDFGGLLAFVLPGLVALWWTEQGAKRLLALIGVALAIICLLLSASRGAMLGAVAGAIMGGFYLRQYISAPIVARTTVAILFIVLFAVVVVLSTEYEYLLETRLTQGLGTGSVEKLSSGRTAIWQAAMQEMSVYPLSYVTGLGWEAYYETVGHRFATHSVYLDRFYNLGIIGLTLFIFTFASTLAVARRGLQAAPPESMPYLVATVIGMAAFIIAMAFSDIHGAATYIWAYTGIALRMAVSPPGN